MRRVMADMVASADMIIYPSAIHAQKNLRIPVAGSDNVGPTGLHGAGEFVRHDQELTLEIIDSGDYGILYLDDGPRFSVKPTYVLDEDSAELMDTPLNMGKEDVLVPCQNQTIFEPQTLVYSRPRMAQLSKWGRLTATTGALGIMTVPYAAPAGGAMYANVFRLIQYDDLSGNDSSENSSTWIATNTLTLVASGGTNTPRSAVVELDDGSILMASQVDGDLLFHKSYDCGENWVLVHTLTGGAIGDRPPIGADIVIGRIGNRAVIVESLKTAGNNFSVTTRYSDDGGLSWSASTTLHTAVVNATADVGLDMWFAADGLMYVLFNDYAAGPVDGLKYYTSADGVNWSTEANAERVITGMGSFFQTHIDTWALYAVHNAGGVVPDQLYGAHTPGGTTPTDANFGTSAALLPGTIDGDGAVILYCHARPFQNNGFVDVVMLNFDDHGGTDYYGLTVTRFAMWNSFQFSSGRFEKVTFPIGYPSTADGHPNIDAWKESSAGTGAVSYTDEWEHESFRIQTTAAAGDEKYYYDDDTGLCADLVNEGVMLKVETRVQSGYSTVHIRVNDAITKNTEYDCFVVFGTTALYLWDRNGGGGSGAQVDSYDCSTKNWNPQDWNTYWIFAKGDDIKVYRAPSQWHRDFECFEEVLSYGTLTVATPGVDNSRVAWGKLVTNNGTWDVATDSYWRSVMLTSTLDNLPYTFDPDTDVNGGRCSWNTLGIMSGFGVKWSGAFAVDEDTWELKTGAAYAPDNVFTSSPRRRWEEPQLAADTATATHSIEFRRSDDDGDCMNFVFDSFAMFGVNLPVFKLIGKAFDGSGSATLFDNSAPANYGANAVFKTSFTIDASYPDQDVIKFTPSTASLYSPEAWDDMLASNDYRNFYIRMLTGAKGGRMYRILGNTADRLMMEINLEAEGVSAADEFAIYSDRFFHYFGTVYEYPRIELQVFGNSLFRPSPSELAARVGTLVVGRTYDLDDDDWACRIRTISNVQVQESLGGLRQFSQMGQERREIQLRYKTLADRGMGNDAVTALYRAARWGIHPVVWIDDRTFSESQASYSHPDPILAVVRGPVTQNRFTYNRVEHDGVWQNRNTWDVDGITLEEVL